jgi:hypothetical protein
VDGTATINGQKVFVLKMIQGRRPEWVNRVFCARFDPGATSLDDLEPAFHGRGFFFQRSVRETNSESLFSNPQEDSGVLPRGWACDEQSESHSYRQL